MNKAQKSYEYYDKTTIFLKLSETNIHQKNLSSISKRKTTPTLFHPVTALHTSFNPVKSFKKKHDDEILNGKIFKINAKVPVPALNEDFIENNIRRRQCSEIKRKEDIRVICKENQRLFHKLCNLQPFISTKDLDNKFKRTHLKLVQQMRKIPHGVPLLELPRINKGWQRSASMVMNNGKNNQNNYKYDLLDYNYNISFKTNCARKIKNGDKNSEEIRSSQDEKIKTKENDNDKWNEDFFPTAVMV